STGTATGDTLTGLSLTEGQIYYLSVRVTDGAGNLSDVVTGDGITIDMTAPVAGTVIDGIGSDVIFTGSDSTLTGEWSNFSDDVSGMSYYEISAGTVAGNDDISPWSAVGNVETYSLTGLSLNHGETYFMSIRGVDIAGNVSESASSNGVIVDRESPNSYVNIAYDYFNTVGWDSTTQITGTASDGLAGLNEINISIHNQNNNTYWFGSGWTSDESWILATGTSNWSYNLASNQLIDEAIYQISSRGTDVVGNTQTIYGTDIFTFDASEPNTTLNTFDPFYNINGWNNSTPIQGSADDATSGIQNIEIAIIDMTYNHYWQGSEWDRFESWHTANGSNNFSFSFPADSMTNGTQYTVYSRATDGAGNMELTHASQTFTLDTTPPTSEVNIDRDYYNNINWSDANSISGTMADDNSGINTIQLHLQRNSDTYSWDGNNWTSSEVWLTPDGDESWTYGLNVTNLTNGVSYTVYSRGEDVAGNVQIEINQDTFTYDVTPPATGQVDDGLAVSDLDWTNSTTQLSAHWSGFSDATSGIMKYEYSAGTSPGATDLISWTDNGIDSSFTADVSMVSGTLYYISVKATDGAENSSNISTSNGITVDATNPIVNVVYEGSVSEDLDFQQLSTELLISWAGSDGTRATFGKRDISGFRASLGDSPGDSNIVQWLDVGNINEYTFSNLDLQEAVTYYANIQAEDLAGNFSDIFTGDGITIDQSGPNPGQVNDGGLGDIDWVNINYLGIGNWLGFTDSLSGIAEYQYSLGLNPGETQVVTWTSAGLDSSITTSASLNEGPTYYTNVHAIDSVGNTGPTMSSNGFGLDVSSPAVGTVNDGTSEDLTWTNVTQSLSATWSNFSDQYSGIDFYEYAIGTSPGAQDITGWTDIDTAQTMNQDGLTLNHETTYYTSIRATDHVENTSNSVSTNGITIDITPPTITFIKETNELDPNYQGSDTTLTLLWTAEDDLSDIDYFEYTIGTTEGDSDLVAWTIKLDTTVVTVTDLSLTEGATYWGSVRAYDRAGNTTTGFGNGVTIDITAPEVGVALDFTDLNLEEDQRFTNSTTTLQTSWSRFSDNLSGIASYEYAMGTSENQTDVFDWTTTILDTLISNSTLSLNNGQSYFTSIRAIDSVGNVSSSISTNGIIADHEGPYGYSATDGDSIDIDRQNNTEAYSGYWSVFTDDLSGLLSYEYALYNSTTASYTTTWEAANLDTVILIENLTLLPDNIYKLHIQGIDSVLNIGSVLSSNGVLIDVSAPAEPQSLVGWFSQERIYVTWEPNTEEDLAYYKVYAGTSPTNQNHTIDSYTHEAETYLTEFGDTETIYLNVTAVDIPGNESVVSNQVFGIPQEAKINKIMPDTSATLFKDQNQIAIHFSQPLSNIGSIFTNSLAYSAMNLETVYSESDTSIQISIIDPWASLDTVLFTLSGIVDWAGNTTDNKQFTFTTYLLGDYNQDFAIDVADLSNFVTGWANDDYSFELGPVSGTPPHFIPSRNEIYDLRDVMAFTRMWHYSHETSALPLMAFRSDGPELDVTQDGHNIIVNLPDQASAAHISIYYPKESKTIEAKGEIHSEDRLQLSYTSEEKGLFISETAYISPTDEKEIIFSMQSLDRNNASIDVGYKIYDQNNQIISSGRKMVEVIAIPDDYALHQNYPNPFNPTTRINYDVPEDGQLQMVIYDLMGREVVTLLNQTQKAGYHHILWNGLNNQGNAISAGMYFCQLRGKNYTKTIKMLLLK
ncbi:MAG: T9SS type A sorting domain-containing protein, partial [Candidatus Marinimicrobia bacterium]|nr:T9SS type A sorting domain-containing protein [Candidatus Neomarinimicrobiota bacterium]